MFDCGEIRVAPNLINTLNPTTRLPLVEDESLALSFEGTIGMFRTWVPSRFGGILEIGCDQPGAKIAVAYKKSPAVDDAGNPVAKSSRVVCTVAPGQFGWWEIAVDKVSGTYRMWALFKEVGIARDGSSDDDDPLIPWNFWYFPYAQSMQTLSAWGSADLQPCQKYETAFSKAGVLDWEKAHHNDPTGTELDWVGHCHNSAPASIIFETPDPAGKTVNGVAFTCEELKFFATEFYGRMGSDTWNWSLPGTGPMGRQGFFQENKPEDNPKRFGTIIGGLHKAIRTMLRDQMKAGVMDMRDVSGSDHAAVWNQAVYKYVAKMWETLPHGDWQDIQIENTLFANDDRLRDDFSSTGSPAKIVATGPRGGGKPKDTALETPPPDPFFRNEILRYRMIFKPDGEMNETHAKTAWLSAQAQDGTGIHAPRFLFCPIKPAGNPSPDGNPTIATADMLTMLDLRTPFK
jgi:hypothetical protein